VLRLLSRRKSPAALPVLDERQPAAAARVAAAPTTTAPAGACALSACLAGSRATVLEMRCGGGDACRLRALGLCEGASVNVVRSRDCTLLEVRGSRLALSTAIAAGITVLPVA
jgi:Fe2+ transport system protein FeoA